MTKTRWLIVLLLTTILIFQDRPNPVPTHRAEWLNAGPIRLRAVRAGRGDTTLFLLHGYAESLLAFRAVFDRLATRYRVVAVDLPGFGVSDKPDGPYDHETMARTLWSFLARNVEGPVVVVGHSLGGQIAAQLALDHPERITALVLIAPAGSGLSPWHAAITEEPGELVAWFNVPLAYVMPIHAPEWLAEPKEWRDYDPLLDPAFRASSAKVLEEFDFNALANRFDQISQPTLLLWGRLDPTIPFSTGQAIARALPCVRFVEFERTLHRPHQTEPDHVVDAITSFLDDPPPCAAPGSDP